MAEWREITDRREPVGADRVRLWYDLGGGTLRSCVIRRAEQSDETVRRVGETLAAEYVPQPRRVYGDGGKAWGDG